MRMGYATATGGWIWGALVGAFSFNDFVDREVPVLEKYCSKRLNYKISISSSVIVDITC